MGRFLVQLTHPTTGETCIVDWSTVSDAPRSYAIPRSLLRDYMRVEKASEDLGYYGEKMTRQELHARLTRLDTKGCSTYSDMTAESAVAGNRAGPGEAELNMQALFEWASQGPTGVALDLLVRGLLVDLLEVLTNFVIPADVFASLAAKLSDEVQLLANAEKYLAGRPDLGASLKAKAAQLQELAEKG